MDAPTRFASTVNCNSSLLDHVYINMPKKTFSGVCLFEQSDHLPAFFIIPDTKSHLTNKPKYKRCMKDFDLEDFLIDLQEKFSKIDFKSTNTSVNNDVYSLTSIFKSTLDKHAPLTPMSRREKKLSDKPWITKGILISIKTKNKLFRHYFKSNDVDKKAFYRKYFNKLTRIKYHAKRNYYENLIKTNNQNSSQIWSIIKEIIECKKNSTKNKLPTAFLIANQMVNTDSQVFLDTLCE